MRTRLFLSTLTLTIAASAVAIVPVTSAEAATNGLTIRTVTKNVVQGDTARIKGKILSGKSGQSLTIQQRSPQKGKDWGSGRQVKTDKDGKWVLDRVIKGKFTRDYRACIGAPGRRKCSLRARIEVVPRVIGLFNQQVPTEVDPGQAVTVRGSSDAALAGRVVQLQQLDETTLKWTTVGSSTVTPAFTYEISGVPLVSGRDSLFRIYSQPFAARSQATLSARFAVDVYANYPLSGFPAVQGGYRTGTPTFVGPAENPVTYTSAVTPSDANTFTVNVAASCNRFTAAVFLDANTSADTDAMNTSVVTAVGANETTRFTAQPALRRNTPRQNVDIRIGDAQTLRITQGLNTNAPENTTDPVWYGNPTLACAY